MNPRKKICIAFLGNAHHDSRIVNLSNSLKKDGCQVSVISFDWFISKEDYIIDDLKIFHLKKGKFSLFFYLNFAVTLLKELINTKADIYFAEDFYTLPFVTIIAKARKAKIYYNSRELYAFLGGLRNRPYLQALVKFIEKIFIRKADLVLTTGEMDSDFLEKFYSINNTLVIRNIPLLQKPSDIIDFRKKLGISEDKFILLYQGVLLEGRGIPVIMRAMASLPETVLVLLGDGEQKNNFKLMSEKLNISDRVIFAGSVSQTQLINYTAAADIGLSLIENISVSYYHALPNKLFEYIMAGLPVLCSDLPQMKKIVEEYSVGEAISIEDANEVVSALQRWTKDKQLLNSYKKNCSTAAAQLNWRSEYERSRVKLLGID